MHYRRALEADYPAIAKLHHDNLWQHLPPDQRQDGFLSIEWTVEQIASANKDLAVVVAVDEAVDQKGNEGAIAGYLGGTTVPYNLRFPLLRKMINLYPETPFQGRPLSEYQSFLYGPVCVAAPHRGTGVLNGMYRELLVQAAKQYEVGVAFVARTNGRSFRAHTHKLGMTHLRDFDFKGTPCTMLAFPVAAKG